MAGLTALAGMTPLAGSAAGAVPQTMQTRPRIACLVSFWGAPGSHADWIITKLMDGYWWQGAHTPSRVDVVSVYIHQFETSLLGQKVCKAKNIPIYKTVGEAVTLGGTELAVDGVVIVGEHGDYPTDLKGHWLLPRWWMYQQVIRVFEQSKRSVPVFNDKHLSYNWDDAKWMFDKSRELNFPLTGGSSIPTYFRKPEIDLAIDTPIKNSIVVGGAADEGAIFHCVDVLQAFVERRKGGETGVKSVQSIRGPETWKWVERNPWAGKLLDSVAKQFRPEAGILSGERPGERLYRGLQRWNESGGNFGPGCGLDLRRRNRRTKRADDRLDAWLARPLLAVPRRERSTALDYRDDGDQKGTVQCGAAAVVYRDCEPLHGIELGERPLLCRRAPHRDAVHEHEIPHDTGTDVREGRASAEHPIHTGF